MSRASDTFSDYVFPYPPCPSYPLAKLNTHYLSQDQKFYLSNQGKNIINNAFTDTLTSRQGYFPSITNDDTTSSCSISELTTSDQQCAGSEDHVSDDITSDQEIRSPDSPTTPTTPFGVNVNISYPSWTLPTVYEISPPTIPQKTLPNYPLLRNLDTQKNVLQQQQNESSPDIASPPQSSPSLSTSSCVDYMERNDVDNDFTKDVIEDDDEKISCNNDDNNINETAKKIYHRKSKEDIFLKFKLPVNGIATRTRSKRIVPNHSESSSSSSSSTTTTTSTSKKRIHLSEEEKILLKYSNKVANIPPFSRKVTIPSMNPQIDSTNTSKKSSNYPIPKTRQQILLDWTYRDQKKFLASYLSEGKNFGQLAKLLNKSTKEVVEFYYYFKMSPEFRSAKTIKKDLVSYSSKLDQITDSITKLKHLSSAGKIIPSPPMRVTFAPSVINSRKRRGRPKKVAVRGGVHYYY